MILKNEGLNCYLLDDQPTTCGKCGSRTNFEEVHEDTQIHECLNLDCGYKFTTVDD